MICKRNVCETVFEVKRSVVQSKTLNYTNQNVCDRSDANITLIIYCMRLILQPNETENSFEAISWHYNLASKQPRVSINDVENSMCFEAHLF